MGVLNFFLINQFSFFVDVGMDSLKFSWRSLSLCPLILSPPLSHGGSHRPPPSTSGNLLWGRMLWITRKINLYLSLSQLAENLAATESVFEPELQPYGCNFISFPFNWICLLFSVMFRLTQLMLCLKFLCCRFELGQYTNLLRVWSWNVFDWALKIAVGFCVSC